MRKYFLIPLLLFTAINLKAQVPGYMGKKFSAGYNLHFYMGGLQSESRKYDAQYFVYQPQFFINKFHEAHADYVLANNYSLGISCEFLRTGKYYSESSNNYYNNYDSDNYLNIAATTIRVNNKFFFYKSGSALAPIGNYGQVSVGVISAKPTAKLKGTNQTDSGTFYFSKIVNFDRVTTPIIAAGFGNQSIFFDRLILDVGLEVAFVPGAVSSFTNTHYSSYYTSYPNKETAKEETLKRLQTFYVSSVKVGIGILLF
ncbi:MAG: hypothetical protein WCI97_05325 [Bacteroidota bacterium]